MMGKRPSGAVWLLLGFFMCVFALVLLELARALPGPLIA